MKKILLACLGLMAFKSASAQSFTENFDSYKAGASLGTSNPRWVTCDSPFTSVEDVFISTDKAHSGKNSVYFTGDVGNSYPCGGFPLGGYYNDGKAVLEAWIYVKTGNNANLTLVGGKQWAMDLTLQKDSSFSIGNDGGNMLSGTYTPGKWMDIKLEIDLSANKWELFMDGNSKGSFSNTVNVISTFYMYCLTDSKFYVDDVSFDYTPFSVRNLDAAAVTVANIPKLAGQKFTPQAVIRNLGKSNITSFDITLDYDGNTLNKLVTGVKINPSESYTVEIPGILEVASTNENMKLTVSNINGLGQDGDSSNDVKDINITPIIPAKGKMVIAEDATGTWCGWCPSSAVFLKTMSDKYAGYFQGIAVHDGDPMADSLYDFELGKFVPGFPTAYVDRTYTSDPIAMENNILESIQKEPAGIIKNGAIYYADSGILKVSLSTSFKYDMSGDYRLACVIVEDSVSGVDSGYRQHNYYAGKSNVMGGFEKLPAIVPAADMIYDQVARAISPGFYGLKNSFPAQIKTGSDYTRTFSFDISKYNASRIHIVGMLIAPDGKMDNGSTSTIAEAVSNGYTPTGVGIEYAGKQIRSLAVFPNPANDIINLLGTFSEGTIHITDMEGSEYLNMPLTPGVSSQAISLAGLNNGIYLMKVQVKEDVFISKIVVQK